MEIINATNSDFDSVFSEIEKNFIEDERRDYINAKKLFLDGKYSILHFLVDGEKVGFITAWDLPDFVFFEHFVVYEGFRNRGYGSLALDALKSRFKRAVLEAEPPHTPLAERRLNFYKRCGFTADSHPYLQPSYRKDGSPVPLVLMSYPEPLEEFEGAISTIYEKVYSCI